MAGETDLATVFLVQVGYDTRKAIRSFQLAYLPKTQKGSFLSLKSPKYGTGQQLEVQLL